MTVGALRGLAGQARGAALTLGLAFAVAACGSVTLSSDGGTTGAGGGGGSTGAAGHGDSGSTGAAGTSGVAGATGIAGATGAAGHGAGGSTGGAGGTGVGGTTGGGGSTGSAGSTGKGGADGGVMCGAVCDIFCQYGNVLDANGCPTCACKPAPAACTAAECPNPPPYAQPNCGSAPIIQAMCLRGTDGQCAWHAPSCGACPAVNCPNLMCANGYVPDQGGCATCVCNTCPSGTHAVACSGVTCNIACPYGFARDANGCDECSCRAAPACAGVSVDCVACPFGYRTGPSGCRTCACEDPPPGCVVNPVATDPTL